MLATEAEICQLRQDLDQASALARHDPLTDALNRKGLDEALAKEIASMRRSDKPLCVAMLDIDNFKMLNDRLGHESGDVALIHLVTVAKESLRPTDYLARYGGEEFVVLLPETDAHGAYAVASNIYRAIERLEIPHEMSEVSPFVTISLGITVFKGEVDLSKVELLGIADQALYRAKQLGRNQIYYQPLTTSTCTE